MTGAWRGLREKLRGARGFEYLLLLVAACVAALLFFQSPEARTGAEPTELEARLERVLGAVDGAGEVRAMVNENEEGVVGALIVAEGAQDIGVRLALMQAARAILNVEIERIEVVAMRGDENAQVVDFDDRVYCRGAGHWRGHVA